MKSVLQTGEIPDLTTGVRPCETAGNTMGKFPGAVAHYLPLQILRLNDKL
jgi:hypothetical protein